MLVGSFDPDVLAVRSHAEYGRPGKLEEMLREDLVASAWRSKPIGDLANLLAAR